MKYLLDTNICIHFLNGTSLPVKNKILSDDPKNLYLCSIVNAELYYGAYKSQFVEKNILKINEFISKFICIPFDNESSITYGKIRASLEKNGTPIGPNDLIVASIAVSNNLILVTNNTKEFMRIENLNIEDWSSNQ